MAENLPGHDDIEERGLCPRCRTKKWYLVCTDGDKYYFCPNCQWSGSVYEIVDFADKSQSIAKEE